MSATLKPVDSPKHVKPVKPFPKLEMPYLCWIIQMVILYIWSHLLICAEVSLKSVFLLLMRVHLCHSVKHEHKAPQKWYFRSSAPHTSWGNDHFCTVMCIANKDPQVDWEIAGGKKWHLELASPCFLWYQSNVVTAVCTFFGQLQKETPNSQLSSSCNPHTDLYIKDGCNPQVGKVKPIWHSLL